MKIYFLVAFLLLFSIGLAKAQDSLNVEQIGQLYDHPGAAWTVALAGDYAYIAAIDSGLRVVDITNPTHPRETGSYDTPGTAYGIAVSGMFAYVADMDSGLRVVNISDPANPHEVGVYYPPHSAISVAVSGNLAFVGDSFDGLRIVDISDPTDPQEVGAYIRILGQSPVNCIVVRDTLVYIGGLEVINVSDPAHPREIGHYQSQGQTRDLAVMGNLVFIASWDDGLRVADVSNPTHPVEIGHYDTPGRAFGVAVDGNLVFVADQTALRVIDVSDPVNPVEVGYHVTSSIAAHASIDTNGLIYLAGYTNLGVYRYSGANEIIPMGSPTLPGSFMLAASFPNPFNSMTRLAFGLPEAAHVALQVFDMNGRLVATLADADFKAGNHSAVWNADASPAGLYMVKIQAGSHSDVRKLTLVK